MRLNTFSHALEYLYAHIPKNNAKKYPGSFGLERTKYLLKLLNNPQEKIKVIHVAGTSGKGSTAYLTALFLHAQGFKTGLHISPHLIDIRERFQINGKMISKKVFVENLNKIIPAIDKVKASKFQSPTYFEILVALAYFIFYQKKVDYAVVETGLGGLYDGTNAVENKNKLSVITRIGYDHTDILGKTLKEIAFQKAGIINKKAFVLTIDQDLKVLNIIKTIAQKKRSELFIVPKPTNIKITKDYTVFDTKKFSNFRLSLVGQHQAENCSLALAAIILLAKRDNFKIKKDKIYKTALSAHFPARFEIRKINNKTLVVDGAHNPQKMNVLINNLKTIFPSRKFHFLLAFKKDKDVQKMLEKIIPLASKITLTSFFTKHQDWIHLSHRPEDLALICEKLGFKNYQVIIENKQALKTALADKNNILVITGSFYLIGELYPILKTFTQTPVR